LRNLEISSLPKAKACSYYQLRCRNQELESTLRSQGHQASMNDTSEIGKVGRQ